MPSFDPYRPLAVESSREPERSVVALYGDLDMSTAPALDTALRAAEATDAQRIIVDLSGLSFIDTTGLRLLLKAQERSQADSNRLRLIRGPRRVQRVFELTNTEPLLPFSDAAGDVPNGPVSLAQSNTGNYPRHVGARPAGLSLGL